MTEDDTNKRASRRNRVLKEAFASFNEKFSAVPCVVRDMSETGAKLRFTDIAVVPERFTLHIPLDGTRVDCERQWATNRDCGVKFVGTLEQSNVRRAQVISSSEPDRYGSIRPEPRRDNNDSEDTEDADRPAFITHRQKKTFGRLR